MAYSVKKAGIPFKLKLDTNKDLTGQAANFQAYYIDDATGAKTDITNAFVEDANTLGLYMVELTIPSAGEYTMVISNPTIGMDNHPASLVVVDTTIEDVKSELDTLSTTVNTVATDVSGVNGANVTEMGVILDNINSILNTPLSYKLSCYDDLTFYNSLSVGDQFLNYYDTTSKMEVLDKYDTVDEHILEVKVVSGAMVTAATVIRGTGSSTPYTRVHETISIVAGDISNYITNSENGLGVLSGYTDDIENMLNGTEFLSDGTTANPFYDATNPGVLKESTLKAKLEELKTNINSSISAAQTAIQNDVAAVQTVIDSNKSKLEDAGYGLSNIKTLLDNLNSQIVSNASNITNALQDASNGLSAIQTAANTRFDTLVSNITNVETTVSSNIVPTKFKTFL